MTKTRFRIWNFGHCYLFDICDLEIGIFCNQRFIYHLMTRSFLMQLGDRINVCPEPARLRSAPGCKDPGDC
jgi:hypothetical protein